MKNFKIRILLNKSILTCILMLSFSGFSQKSATKAVSLTKAEKTDKIIELEKSLNATVYKSNYGFIISNNKTTAEFMANQYYKAYTNFVKYFLNKPPIGAIIDSPSISNEDINILRDLGVKFQLPFPISVIFNTEKSQKKIKTIEDPSSHNSAIDHELGHLFLINSFMNWQNGSDGYGGPAPDWLDESAAILNENEYLTKTRRDDFYSMGHYSLKELVNIKHPVPSTNKAELAKKIQELRAQAKNGSMAANIKIDDKQSQLEIKKFYSNVRMFIDFLKSKTKNPQVFNSITEHLSQGHDFENWLSKNHKIFGLKATIEELNQDWEEFIINYKN